MQTESSFLVIEIDQIEDCLFAVAAISLGLASTGAAGAGLLLVVHTDGHLRPGHFETIWVKRVPGRGGLEVAFFPTAIRDAECGSVSRWGGFTSRKGRAKFRVRVPQTFINREGTRVPYRNRERIELLVRGKNLRKKKLLGRKPTPSL